MSVVVEFRGDCEGVPFDDTVGWEFRLNVGRRSWAETAQPAVLEMSVVWSSASLGVVNINDWQLGDKIKLQFKVAAVDAVNWPTIFYGAITDITVDRNIIRIIAVDIVIGSLGRTWIDVPEQTNVTLQTAATAVVSAAQTAGALLGCTVSYQGLTQQDLTVPAQTNVNALQALNSLLASEPSGCLGTRIGTTIGTPQLRVCGLNARRVASMPTGIKYDLSAESDAFFYEWRVEKRVSDLVNKAVISYNNGTQTFTDTASVAAVGTYAVAVNTNLNQATNADYLARRYVLRNNDPAWRVEPLTVDMRKLTNTLCYNIGRYIQTTGSWIRIPALYAGAQTDYFIEGFSDTIRYSTAPGGSAQWFRTFYVTDVNATDAPQRWQDVTSGVTWATVNPAYTWLDLEEIDI